jgi:hypothetical protein
MKITKVILCLACLAPGWLMAQDAKVTEILSKDLSNIPGKEGLMITVVYPPVVPTPYIATMRMGLSMYSRARS